MRAGSFQTLRKMMLVRWAPAYQYYINDGRALTQLSTSLMVAVPIGQRFSVRAQGSVARAGGDGFD